MKFAADCMLGTLAKWLIILGHDVTYYRRIEDDELVAVARREKRTILTCDRKLVERRAASDHILVKSSDLKEQIHQVMSERGLTVRADRLFRRCLGCNETTRLVPRGTVRGQVPAYVYRTQSRFRRCPQCGKLYWRATHVERMLDTLRG
ncbi:MAG TPA: Mut7-C RNAse domain-containing protein [Candidatus Polarisedimenticolia bacterium]|nr:Mut7-C RNAse domain-containing protein [Candidatus Polarisedimenticolia bacterium]